MLPRLNRFVATVLAASAVLVACGGPGTSLPEDDGGSTPASEDAGFPGSEPDDGGVTDCLPVSGTGTPILTGIANARRLAADDQFLYVSVRGSLTGKDGKVIRVPLAGGLPSDVVTGVSAPDALAVSNGVLFVLDDTGLWRVDVGTGAKSRLDTSLNNALFGETAVLVEGSSVIVATGYRALVRVEQDGSASQNLYLAQAGSSVRGLARSGNDLFFLVAQGTDAGLWHVPIDGSTSAERLRTEPTDGHALILDGDQFVWSEGADGNGRTVSAPIAGGEATVLADGLSHPFQLLRYQGALYFKDTTAASADFLRGIGACGVSAAGPEGSGPGDLLEAGGVLYFSSEAPGPEGYVSRLP